MYKLVVLSAYGLNVTSSVKQSQSLGTHPLRETSAEPCCEPFGFTESVDLLVTFSCYESFQSWSRGDSSQDSSTFPEVGCFPLSGSILVERP